VAAAEMRSSEMLPFSMRRGKKNSRERLDCLLNRLQGDLSADYSLSKFSLPNTLSETHYSQEKIGTTFFAAALAEFVSIRVQRED
jgi:hypothetical protein